MKVVENSPQNARNCPILKNFLGGACPQTRHSNGSRHADPKSENFLSWTPSPEKSCIRPCGYYRMLNTNHVLHALYTITLFQ